MKSAAAMLRGTMVVVLAAACLCTTGCAASSSAARTAALARVNPARCDRLAGRFAWRARIDLRGARASCLCMPPCAARVLSAPVSARAWRDPDRALQTHKTCQRCCLLCSWFCQDAHCCGYAEARRRRRLLATLRCEPHPHTYARDRTYACISMYVCARMEDTYVHILMCNMCVLYIRLMVTRTH